MKITKVCQFNGETYTIDIPALTPEKLAIGTAKRNMGMLIQHAFPYLSSDEREFLMTGTPPEVWNDMFSKPEE